MANSSTNRRFRQVDVDKYNDNNFEEDTGESDAKGLNQAEVLSLLNAGKNVEALKAVLANPPVSTKNQPVKDEALQLVLKVLMEFRSGDMDTAIRSLDQPTLDTLMKYVYRGFEIPSEGSSAQLLTWHEKVYAAGGIGCIVRVLTDRKKV